MILNDLDVAIDRAPTARDRQRAVTARGQIAALTDPARGAPQDLKAIDRTLTKVVQRFADCSAHFRPADLGRRTALQVQAAVALVIAPEAW